MSFNNENSAPGSVKNKKPFSGDSKHRKESKKNLIKR